MSAYWKIPLQVLVLLVGVLVFVFYVFTPPPLLFSPRARRERLRTGAPAPAYAALAGPSSRRRSTRDARRPTALGARRRDAATRPAVDAARPGVQGARGGGARRSEAGPPTLVRDATRRRAVQRCQLHHPDVHPHAAADRPRRPADCSRSSLAATDTIAGELNSLSTATVIDFYKRWLRPEATDAHYLHVSKVATGLWGTLRLRRRRLGGGARIAHRSGQPLRVVLLRLDPRASSSWPSPFRARRATARSSG